MVKAGGAEMLIPPPPPRQPLLPLLPLPPLAVAFSPLGGQ